MDFVHEVNLTIAFSEFVLGVHEDESHLLCDFLSALEDCSGVFFDFYVIFFRYDALCDDFFAGDVFIVSF